MVTAKMKSVDGRASDAAAARRARIEALKNNPNRVILPTIEVTAGRDPRAEPSVIFEPVTNPEPSDAPLTQTKGATVSKRKLAAPAGAVSEGSKRLKSYKATPAVEVEVIDDADDAAADTTDDAAEGANARQSEVETPPSASRLVEKRPVDEAMTSTEAGITAPISLPLAVDPARQNERSYRNDYCQKVIGALAAVPPLPNMASARPRWAKLAEGLGLSQRVAVSASNRPELLPLKGMEMAIADFGHCAHSVSTLLWSTFDGMLAADEKNKADLKSKADLEEKNKKLEEELSAAKLKMQESEAAKEEALSQMRRDSEKRISDLEGLLKASQDRERKTAEERQEISDKLVAEIEAHKLGRDVLKKTETDLEAARQAEATAETTLAATLEQIDIQIEDAIEDFKKSEEYLRPVLACYEQGAYHMVRCQVRAAGLDETHLNLRQYAEWLIEDQFSESLKRFHPWFPYSEEDLKDYNQDLAEEGLPPWEAPAVKVPNLRILQKELLQAREAKEAAEKAAKEEAERKTAEEAGRDAADD